MSRAGSGQAPPGVSGALRVLISFSPKYASYGEAILLGLRRSRAGLRAYLVTPARAAEAVRPRFHLVISDGDVAVAGAATVKLSAEPTGPSAMRIGGTVREVVNPSFDNLLAFVDEVGRTGTGRP